MGVKMPANSSSRFEGGYTLVELIVAVLVFSIMFVSLYMGIAFGFGVSRSERENLRATQIILERMEGIRLFNYDQLSDTSLNPLTFTKTYYPQASGGQSQGITYTGTVSVVSGVTLDPTATYSADMKKITVQLNWVSGGVARSRTVSTYSARNGIQNYIISTNKPGS
jgi:prepilin-type N-terminal cleavage/methylation domain-containing protein